MQSPPRESYHTVLFDLDGTLIDHFTTIYRCYRYALSKLGLEPVSYETVRATVGGSIKITFGKLIPQMHVEEAISHFREEFDRIWHEDIEVLPGADWLLKQLHARGIRLAVFTNKEGQRSRRIMKHIGLMDRLDGVFGTLDTPWCKPQAEFTHHVLTQMQAEPANACMVGDSPYDIDSAAVVDMPCYTVATGSHTMEQLHAENRAAGVYPDLYALGEAVFGLSHEDT